MKVLLIILIFIDTTLKFCLKKLVLLSDAHVTTVADVEFRRYIYVMFKLTISIQTSSTDVPNLPDRVFI